MFSSPNLTFGMLSIIFISLAKMLSRTAGKVSSTSISKTGRPLLIALFILVRKLPSVSFSTFLGCWEKLLLSHLKAWFWGSIKKGHLLPCLENMAFSIETVSEGSPSMIQSLTRRGSPRVLITEESSLMGSYLDTITLFQ